MDFENKKRWRSVKVIASEMLMVVAVIVMVVVLAFLVSGYWINSEGRVDRQGLLQLSSIPTGATVTIDGVEGSWIERTNMSKNLMNGEHTIELKRDGYDTWSKTVYISEGLLYRLHYPRLFLQERSREDVMDVANYTRASISPDHAFLILTNDTTEWVTVNLNSEQIKPTKVSVADLFMATANAAAAKAGEQAMFSGEIEDVKWDRDGSHALFKVKFGDNVEWLLFDVKNPKNSVNITRQFGLNFSEIQILDNSSNNLLVVQNGNLQRIDLGAKSISSVIVEQVVHFDHYNQSEVVFSAKNTDSGEDKKPYYVGIFKIGDGKIKKLEETDEPAMVTLSKFYEDKFITTLIGDSLKIYDKDNFELEQEFGLTFRPTSLVVGHDGEFQTMREGKKVATLDMESMTVAEWEIEGDDFDWIDNDMVYSVKDGDLIVYDYDGLNRRVIAKNVSSRFPVAITDDKWLYYFSDGELVREWLIPR